ncbi:2Fe-2S iron-sulfur cluster-binding protein [Chengkuizengella axinellae]|uniref:2Fe-2S iron-sulfur cluster-binding protein n=1 Tax=Chengkuizengella axinellae TaxID=3064388 RepID=A0ABT9IWQ9_9BACL|nr:2Fe-2S iron-sulfur cluster-binding protein [Chengkuizengella sp. 2205SS18-9]MDP5273787.1 2Fe-2S iron-sulfur cluster-binding protein [Chengkuizengella sp. 2205SS18-9]
MFRKLFFNKNKSSEEMQQNEDELIVKLKGQFKEEKVKPELQFTLLDLALKHNIDWQFACTNGNCARCRCYVEEGAEFLSEVNSAEKSRLDLQEIKEGYRLGCQAEIVKFGAIKAMNKTYFNS